MSHWNHRVVKRIVKECGEDVEWFGIHEVFYGVEGKIVWTDAPIAAQGESVDELRETLERMLACLAKPVIDGTK